MKFQPSEQRDTPNSRQILLTTATILLLAILALSLYTLTHEGGHALAALAFGGKITTFNANFVNFSAHVSYEGEFSTWQTALITAAGVSFPILLSMSFLLFCAWNDGRVSANGTETAPGLVFSLFKIIVFLASVNALLAYMAIPILAMLGKTVSDDSYALLQITQMPPLVLTGAVLLVYLACWALFLYTMGGWQSIVTRLRHMTIDFSNAREQKVIGVLAGSTALVLAAIIGLGQALPDQQFGPPADYLLAAEINLAQGPLNEQTLYQFTIDQPGQASFFFAIEDLQGAPTALHLVGPDGYDNVFLQSSDPQMAIAQGSVHPQDIPLTPGVYEVRGTFQPSPGKVRLFIKIQ